MKPVLALSLSFGLCSCSWNLGEQDLTISDSLIELEEPIFHNSRPIRVEFDRNMLIAMNLPVHIAREKIRESMAENSPLPMEEWTISHWKERVRVTSFADLSYENERTTISTEGMDSRAVMVDPSVAP